jgi:hypothetical protein
VTNSFHLSSAFTTIFDELDAVQGNLSEVALAVQQVGADLLDVNESLALQLTDLSLQLDANVSMLYVQAEGNYGLLRDQLDANVTQLLDALDALDVEVNLTPVLDAIDALELSLAAEFAVVQSNLSVVLDNQALVLANQVSLASALDEVNLTTTSIYQYLTGTLTNSIDQVLIDLGVLNATVNRIEVYASEINETTQQILAHQEEQVVMTVFSG